MLKIIRNEINNSYFVLFLFLIVSMDCKGNQLCFSYDKYNSIVIGVDILGESSLLVKSSDDLFGKYIALAKTNEKDAIPELFSKLDGSRDKVIYDIGNIDKYSNFNKISSFKKTGDPYLWGDYVINFYEYMYEGKEIVFPEVMVCKSANNCQMSLLFEGLNENADLIQNLINDFFYKKSELVDCPNKTESTLLITPDYQSLDSHPIRVYFSNLKKLKNIEHNDFEFDITENLSKCYQKLLSIRNVIRDETKLTEINSVLSKCSLNMDIGSMVPVNLIKPERRLALFDIFSFISLLLSADEYKEVLKIKGDISQSFLIKLKKDEEVYLVFLPFRKQNGKYFFDWIYFGGSVAKLMESDFFVDFVSDGF